MLYTMTFLEAFPPYCAGSTMLAGIFFLAGLTNTSAMLCYHQVSSYLTGATWPKLTA
jgi:hypothetical protein